MYILENDVEWTQELKDAFKHNVTKAKIICGEDEINYDNGLKDIEIEDTRYVPKVGFIGQAVAKKATINLIDNQQELNLENKEIEIFIGADYNNQTYYINYGKFIVNSSPQNDKTNNTIKIVAYDYMIKFNENYTDTMTYPCTLKQLLQSICTQAGVELGTETFANQNFSVTDNQFEGKTLREVLQNIAKCAFSWARIGQDNKLYLDFEVNDTITETLTIDDYYKDSYKIANEYYGAINKVTYGESNIVGQEESVEDTEDIELHGEKELVINDNYFGYTTEKRHQLIQAGTRLFGLKYMPVQELKTIGLIYLDCNDIIKVIDENNNYITTRVFSHIIRYNGITKDEIKTESKSNNENKYQNINSPAVQNSRTEIMVDRANKQILSIAQEIGDRSEKTTTITQDLDTIASKVENIADLTKEQTGIKTVTINDAFEGGNMLELHIYGNNSVFNYLYPRDDLYPSDTLYPYGDSRIRFTNQNGTTELDLGIMEVLRSNTETRDEFVIIDGEANVIRRVNSDGTTKQEEETTYLGTLNFQLTEGDNTFEVVNYFAEIMIKYVAKNEFTDIFSTKAEMHSEISQTAEEINLEVSKKVDSGQVIASINLSSEEASINANKININGVISANGNFQIDTEGNVSLAGNIYMTGTNTKIVGGDGLITNLQFYTSGLVGHYYDTSDIRYGICCFVNIPSNFVIQSAKLTVMHSTVEATYYYESGQRLHYGNSKNVSCTKNSGITFSRTGANVDVTQPIIPDTPGEVIAQLGSFNGNQAVQVDITNSLSSGPQYLVLADYVNSVSSFEQTLDYTGNITMFVDVIGYMKLNYTENRLENENMQRTFEVIQKMDKEELEKDDDELTKGKNEKDEEVK